ncbi:hypothetical protein F5883DRAFT_126702 [Diaporthe sp. PMI_573]|nr:hypothetical protein F5883DRAFT_126702 [Diaporthaceae sp. PMI_573]
MYLSTIDVKWNDTFQKSFGKSRSPDTPWTMDKYYSIVQSENATGITELLRRLERDNLGKVCTGCHLLHTLAHPKASFEEVNHHATLGFRDLVVRIGLDRVHEPDDLTRSSLCSLSGSSTWDLAGLTLGKDVFRIGEKVDFHSCLEDLDDIQGLKVHRITRTIVPLPVVEHAVRTRSPVVCRSFTICCHMTFRYLVNSNHLLRVGLSDFENRTEVCKSRSGHNWRSEFLSCKRCHCRFCITYYRVKPNIGLEIVIDTWYTYGDFLFFKRHPCDLDGWEKYWDPLSSSTVKHSNNDPYGATGYSRKFVYPTAMVTPRTNGNPSSQLWDDLQFEAARTVRRSKITRQSGSRRISIGAERHG